MLRRHFPPMAGTCPFAELGYFHNCLLALHACISNSVMSTVPRMSPVIHRQPIMAWQELIVNASYHQTGGRRQTGLSAGCNLLPSLANACKFALYFVVVDDKGDIPVPVAHHAEIMKAFKRKLQFSSFGRGCRVAAIRHLKELLICDTQYLL